MKLGLRRYIYFKVWCEKYMDFSVGTELRVINDTVHMKNNHKRIIVKKLKQFHITK